MNKLLQVWTSIIGSSIESAVVSAWYWVKYEPCKKNWIIINITKIYNWFIFKEKEHQQAIEMMATT